MYLDKRKPIMDCATPNHNIYETSKKKQTDLDSTNEDKRKKDIYPTNQVDQFKSSILNKNGACNVQD